MILPNTTWSLKAPFVMVVVPPSTVPLTFI